jgi:mRNA interferase MazF
MITSKMSRAGHASRVLISLASPKGKKPGLKSDSVVATDNLATILDYEVERVIGSLASMTRVDNALKHTLGL